MIRTTVLALALALPLALAAGQAGAAEKFEGLPTGPAPPPLNITPDPNYVTPKIGEAFARELAALPDWNGSWFTLGVYMFDPDHTVLGPGTDLAFDTGPLEGSYLTSIPYKPEYQKLYEEAIKRSLKGEVQDPMGDCRQPHGMPRQMGASPGGPEIIVLPSQVRMTWYWFNATRRIYTDGRKHPAGDDLVPSFMGHSIGKWEGDTLVVDTVGMHPGIYDRSEAPHSDQVHVTERMKLVGPDLLEARVTVEDPVMLTGPFTVTRYFRRISKVPAFEAAYCEGGRIEMRDGVQHLVLPAERGESR